MRILFLCGLLALGACATPVNDSLERRGVDARMVLAGRVTDARADAMKAKSSIDAAADALGEVEGLDGSALASQLARARAAGQDAALAAQDLRLSRESADDAAGRYIGKQEERLSLIRATADAYERMVARLDAMKASVQSFSNAYKGASLRLSPALSLYDAEVSALRRNATSGVAAQARRAEREAAIDAARSASASLDGAIAAADGLLGAIETDPVGGAGVE